MHEEPEREAGGEMRDVVKEGRMAKKAGEIARGSLSLSHTLSLPISFFPNMPSRSSVGC